MGPSVFEEKCATSFCLALGVHSIEGEIGVSEFSRSCKCFKINASSCCGRVAQLGEHLLCKQGVAGSIPVTSTNLIPALSIIYAAASPHRDACSRYAPPPK